MSLATKGTFLPHKVIPCLRPSHRSRRFCRRASRFRRRAFCLRCRLRLGCHFFLQVLLREHCHSAVCGVGKHITHNLGDLCLQFLYKLRCVIFLMLYVAQFLLPYTREFATFQQFLAYQVYQFNARRSSNKVFPLSLDIMPFEESFNNTCPR